MKETLISLLLVLSPGFFLAQAQNRQQGTIVRMRMGNCAEPPHRFMTNMSGGSKVENGLQCPEYVLVADKVVYIISGKSNQLLPLAETTLFRLQKNEMLIRIEDEAKESHFYIKAMLLRTEWEHAEMLEESAATEMISRRVDPAASGEQ